MFLPAVRVLIEVLLVHSSYFSRGRDYYTVLVCVQERSRVFRCATVSAKSDDNKRAANPTATHSCSLLVHRRKRVTAEFAQR